MTAAAQGPQPRVPASTLIAVGIVLIGLAVACAIVLAVEPPALAAVPVVIALASAELIRRRVS